MTEKAKQFFTMPFIRVLSFAGCLLAYKIFPGWIHHDELIVCVSLIIDVFAGGYLFSRIESKKIRILSVFFTVFFIITASITPDFIWYLLIPFDAMYFDCFISPVVYYIVVLLPQTGPCYHFFFETFAGTILFGIFTNAVPVAIIVLSSKIFKIDNKKLKSILLSLIAVLCTALFCIGAKEIITEKNIRPFGHYDVNGVRYAREIDVPFYDTNGNIYHRTEEGLVDENKNEYYYGQVYVNTDGYIFILNINDLRYRRDIDPNKTDWNFIDSDGNIYASLQWVKYKKDGTVFTGFGDEYKNKQYKGETDADSDN